MKILSKKLNVVEEFVKRITHSTDKIAKILLYGSVAEGTPTSDSDIDILIFAFGSEKERKKLEEKVDDISFDLMMEKREVIETLVYPVIKWYIPNYFIYTVKKYGKEVYTMGDEEIKREVKEKLFLLAKEYLETAEMLFRKEKYRIVCDTGYNACELMIKALLLDEMEELLCKKGKISKEIAKRLKKALKIRNSARYDYDAEIDEKDASEILSLAKELQKLFQFK